MSSSACVRMIALSTALACGLVAPRAWAQDAGAPDAGQLPGDEEPPVDDEEDDDWGEAWTEDDEEWADEGDDDRPADDPMDYGDGDEDEPPETAEERPTEAEPGDDEDEEGEDVEDTAVGEDDEAVEGQEEGLLPPQPPVLYRPPLPEPGTDDFQLVIPPLLYQRQGGVQDVAFFPIFYWRESPPAAEGEQGTTEVTIPPYYAMRGEQNWDVLFPIFWWFRGEGHHTWVVPPVWSHESSDGFDFGVAPLVMAGRHGHEHYTLIPPLLTIDWGDEHERFTFAALFWRIQERYTEHWGLFPFLWVENAENTSYTIAPPLFFRFEDRNEGTALTIVPPFYHRDEPNGSYFGIPPLFHHNSGPGHTSTTLFPLLSHYSEEEDAMRLVLGGVFWYWRDHGDETIVTPLYQRFRGATEMDAVTPLFYHIRDPRTDSLTLMITPLFWHVEDPGTVNTVLFPFFGRFEERGRQRTWVTPVAAHHVNEELGDETTWVFPTIQVSRWHDGDAVNIHPIWYFESVPSHQHSVLAPFWWDFEEFTGDRNRYTVLFPFYWRIREGNTTSTLVMNVYHQETTREDGSSEWEFSIFPFFSYGESSTGGHWWKLFYGLIGYERRGAYGITTLAYIPFQTDGPPLESDDD